LRRHPFCFQKDIAENLLKRTIYYKMKYSRLTKEQFEELHQEFINFLATQSVTADEWTNLKVNRPELAEMELDVFSDLIWEGALSTAKYLEHFSPQQMHLFSLNETNMQVIAVKLKNEQDLTTTEGYKWLRENLMDEHVEFLQAKKEYTEDKNLDKFKLIEQGAVITKGDLFKYFDTLIN
jgi:hypothetical protein